MSVDVDIYMKNIITFFKNNPKELLSLVPKSKEEVFYDEIKKTAITNIKKGEDVSLTRKQFIDICLELNNYKKSIKSEEFFQKTKFGNICLN